MPRPGPLELKPNNSSLRVRFETAGTYGPRTYLVCPTQGVSRILAGITDPARYRRGRDGNSNCRREGQLHVPKLNSFARGCVWASPMLLHIDCG